MWILPRQLHTSPFVPDTAALISDSTEQSEICAQSLLARSKPSPARTWSQRWKRDSWTRHLSGRILKPSHGPSFVTAWTSSLAATRANPSAQLASDSAPKTHDTSGRLSQPELLQCDQVPAFLKTSTDISRWGFPTCCKTWQDWVTERRGAWRARVNAARHIRGSGSSSWPTMGTTQAHISGQGSSTIEEVAKQRTFHLKQRTNKHGEIVARKGGKTHQATLASAVVGVQNWPTANARDWKDSITGTHPPSRPRMSEQTLGQAVSVVHGANWPTASMSMTAGYSERQNCESSKKAGHVGNELLRQVIKHGQAAPASSSSLGSRQGSAMRLNPRWVEVLQGLPIGWTMPSCTSPVTIAPTSCDSSEMALCQPSQSERSDFLLAS